MPKATRGSEPIEALLKEGRKFPPPKAFAKAAQVKSAAIYREARRNPVRFWERQARESVAQAVAKGARVEAAVREVVHRRKAQRLRQLPRSAHRRAAAEQGGDPLGG